MRSILNQTYKKFELIIINDGSTDDSMKIIKSFSDERIIIVDDGFNKGLPYRLNQVNNLARGKYIARMDADDIMHPERIETQVKILDLNPNIDVLGTNAYSINEENKIVGVRMRLINDGNLIDVNSFIHPTIMGKADWFRKNNYNVDVLRCEDAELWFRTKNFSNFKTTDIPLLFYREFGGNYYKKYYKATQSSVEVLKTYLYKKDFKSSFVWIITIIDLIIKYFLYRLFAMLKIESLLVNQRNKKINSCEIKLAIIELNKALK
jgi:glycosyltransferase involved in cell wall biosynthesis